MNAQVSFLPSAQGEVTIVSLSGRVDIEKASFLRQTCLKKFQNKKMVFCLNELNFVGSSGIQTLFQMMDELKNNCHCEVKMTGVHSDFQRLFWHYGQANPLEMHENLEKALLSFQKATTSEII